MEDGTITDDAIDLVEREHVMAVTSDAEAADYVVDYPIPPHAHRFIEMAFVLEGDGTHRTPSGEERIETGDVVVIRPGTWHAYRPEPRLWLYNLYLGPESLHSELGWVLEIPPLAAMVLRAGSGRVHLDGPAIGRAARWLSDLAAAPLPPAKLGLAAAVLGEIAGGEFEQRGAELGPVVRRAMRTLQLELDRPWSMPDLARISGVSPSYLHRLFRAEAEESPLAWLTRMRAEKAAALLTRTNMSIGEIGRVVGWLDAGYAGRRFRAAYGMSPSEYRHRYRSVDTRP
jgi:AraC family L-rhamnose operon transcriptional activator RhaR